MSKFIPFFVLCGLLLPVLNLSAQDRVYGTFRDTRVINAQSVETLPARKLDLRITHRFGDLAGENGGYQTFFGLENASDILIGLEYGISDRLNIGVFRTKGAGSFPDGTPGLRQLLNGTLKYRVLWQRSDNSIPFSLTLSGLATMSTAKKVESEAILIQGFPKFAHRMAYHGQISLARKYTFGLSVQLNLGYTYRNLVLFNDTNDVTSAGLAARMQLSKVVALIVDATFPVSDIRNADNGFYPAIGGGLEIDTGGHVFQINLTNATAIMETDFVPYTTSSWGEGQFRLGFTISRLFNL